VAVAKMRTRREQGLDYLFVGPGLAAVRGGPERLPEDGAALERWAEQGIAPDRLIGSGSSPLDPEKTMTRPLCPYPQQARDNGSGDINDAASFSCALPK
jgi:feruloyl esterase